MLRKDDECGDVGEEEGEDAAVVLIFVVVKQPISLSLSLSLSLSFGVCLARSRVPFATRAPLFFFCREARKKKRKIFEGE